MENYFILLELPFDPPEGDTNKISDAISKKQAQWSREMSNPVKKAKASEYLAHLEDIKKVMLDPAARKQEASKAKQVKDSKAKELDAKLKLYRAKADSLSEKDLKQLVKVFGAFGFTADEIKKRFGSGSKKEEKIDPSEVLDKTQARNIKNFMQQLDMKDKSLYDFLGLAPTSSCNQLCEAADAMKKKILAKGDKTGRDNAVQSLCGLCVVIFKDVANKRKYDNYVNLTKYGAVNDAVDELALGNQKRIEPKMKESLIDIAVAQYRLSVSDASVYINHYCEYMGYALPENKIVCGLCGTENPAGTTNCVKCGKPLIIICPACGAENFLCVGAQKILMNCIPSIVNGTLSDAFVVKLLFNNRDIQRDYCMYLKLYASYYREDSIDCKNYEYYRPLDVAENELLYYHEIQSILTEINQVVVD